MHKLYKLILSPIIFALFGAGCRYQPTCSQYADEAIKRYGILRGGMMGIKRVLSCHPFAKKGIIFDPVQK